MCVYKTVVQIVYSINLVRSISRDSSVGIATCYRLDDPGLECRFQWPSGLRRAYSGDRLLGGCGFESCAGHGCLFCVWVQ